MGDKIETSEFYAKLTSRRNANPFLQQLAPSEVSLAEILAAQRNNPYGTPSPTWAEILGYNSKHRVNDRHKVFVSYYHTDDQDWRERFEGLFSDIHDIIVSKSVEIGHINPYFPPDRIRQIIRDDYLQDSTVTVVLIGPNTWKRKYVDWEIGSSIRSTKNNRRSGLLGILLPTYPKPSNPFYDYWIHTIPPRLYDNIKCGFAELYDWNEDPNIVKGWIHEAFKRRNKINPDNSYTSFKNNRSGRSRRWYD